MYEFDGLNKDHIMSDNSIEKSTPKSGEKVSPTEFSSVRNTIHVYSRSFICFYSR